MEQEEIVVLDWNEGRTLIGATEKQMLFARALSMGANQTQACAEAGYGGSRAALRGMGVEARRQSEDFSFAVLGAARRSSNQRHPWG